MFFDLEYLFDQATRGSKYSRLTTLAGSKEIFHTEIDLHVVLCYVVSIATWSGYPLIRNMIPFRVGLGFIQGWFRFYLGLHGLTFIYTRRVREFFGASLWLLRPSLAWCFPVRKLCFALPCLFSAYFFVAVLATSFLVFFGKTSDDTLGGFLALLCGFSVLHGHVSLSGSHVLGLFWAAVSAFQHVLQPCWPRRF